VSAELRQRGVALKEVSANDGRPSGDASASIPAGLWTSKLTQQLGLSQCSPPPAPESIRRVVPRTVTIGLRSPSGATRTPVVGIGEAVARGERLLVSVAQSDDVDIHSPLAGTVTALDLDDGITVRGE
jgi:hypothetical protein